MSMNIIFNLKKSSLKLWMVLLVAVLLGACAYDAITEEGDEFQSRNLSIDNDSSEDLEDLIISERIVMTSYPDRIGRLIILETGVITTNGHELKLEVEEIVSHGGTIDTTPVYPKLKSGEHGRNAKTFHLVAKSGRGDLTIIAKGQDGAKGSKGIHGATGAKGGRGHNGEYSYERRCWLSTSPITPMTPREPEPPCEKHYYCSKQTGDGGRGHRGGQGSKGGTGGNAGLSSPVLIEVTDPSKLTVSTQVQAGLGGSGGDGGSGGQGGAGGDAGKRDSKNLCRVAKPGPKGPLGPRGSQGNNGSSGKKGTVCLKLGNARIGDCTFFQ